jgi:hypothetical protein
MNHRGSSAIELSKVDFRELIAKHIITESCNECSSHFLSHGPRPNSTRLKT